MSKVIEVIRHELKEAVFPTIFFWLVFHFMILSKSLILESYKIEAVAVASATIAALIVAKAILIINATPFGRHFMDRRLIYPILWRSFLYSALVFLFRYLEELIPLWSDAGSFAEGNRRMLEEVSWPKFAAIQLWLFVSIMVYSTIVVIDEHLGAGTFRKALFHRREA